jgi:hypothetical protein
MRDNPTAATSLALLLLATIVGGAYYLLVMRHPAPVPPTPSPKAPTTWQTITPRPGQENSVASDAPRVPAETSKGRTDTPIKCFDPEVGEFWTNAATCQGADMNKQLSNPAPQVSSSSPVADTRADKTAEGTASTRADRAKLMGQDYMPPEEAATRSHSDKDN